MRRDKRVFRRPAWIAGAVTFLLFETVGAIAIFGIASLRCCGGGRAAPQDSSEWIGLALLMLGMMVLGLVLAGGASLAVESVHRLADRARRSQ